MARSLYVEDTEEWAVTVSSALSNHDVTIARSFDEATSAAKSGGLFDLFLVDLNLIGHDDLRGGEFLEFARHHFPQVGRLVLTGSPPKGPMRANIFERYGVEDIIIKGSFDLSDLRGIIEDALKRATDDLDEATKLQRSELRQRIRDWRRAEMHGADDRVRQAEEFVASAARVSRRSRLRAEGSLEQAKGLRAQLVREAARLDTEVEAARSSADLVRVAEMFHGVERAYAEATEKWR